MTHESRATWGCARDAYEGGPGNKTTASTVARRAGPKPGGGGAWPTGAEVSFRSRVQSDTGAAATATAVSQ